MNGADNAPLQFSVYDEVQPFIDQLSEVSNTHVESLAMFLDAKRAKLRELTIKGHTVTKDNLNYVDDVLDNRYSLTSLTLMFARKSTLHDGLFKLLGSGELDEKWVESISDILEPKGE